MIVGFSRHLKPLQPEWIQRNLLKYFRHLKRSSSLQNANGEVMCKKSSPSYFTVRLHHVSPVKRIFEWYRGASCNNCLLFLLSIPFYTFFRLPPSFRPWTDQWTSLGSSSWVRQLFSFLNIDFAEHSIFHVPHMCQTPHTKHTIQHNKAAHLGKLMWASCHGNTVAVN